MAKTTTTQNPRDTTREPIDVNALNIKNKPPTGNEPGPKTFTVSQPAVEPPAELVALPSHGILYGDVTDDAEVLDGQIKVRPMTMTEEKILATPRLIKTGQALDMVYRNCVKSNIDPADLLSSDRIYLMFYLRSISYGAEYTFTMRCPSPTCGKKFTYTIDISKQAVKELPEDVTEPIELKLERSGATLYYTLPRGKTEAKARALRDKQVTNVNAVDNATTDRLKLMIEKIVTPDGDELPRPKWQMFLDSLIAYDSAMIREDMMEKDGGIEPIKNIECPYCQEEFDEDIPITTEFFRV